MDFHNVILNQPEKIQENLSSYQIASILDQLLYKALYPLVLYSNILDYWISELLPLIIKDSRRKVSRVPMDQLVSLGFSILMTKDKDEKFEYLVQMRLERNQIFHILYNVCDNDLYFSLLYKSYKPKYRFKLKDIEDKLKFDSKHWHTAILQSRYWRNLASTFKQMIAEKYYKYAYKKAKEAEYATKLHISLDELFNNYIIAIYRAIDKYDSNHGMLSTYIALWLKNASNNSAEPHEYNIAFTIPASQLRNLQKQDWTTKRGLTVKNIMYSLDEVNEDEHIQTPDYNNIELLNASQLGRKLPKLGELFLISQIPYPLTEKEQTILRKTKDWHKPNIELKLL